MSGARQRTGLLLRGCDVLTMNEAREELEGGDILVRGSRLEHVGPRLPNVSEDWEVIDATGLVALPGFVNTHHHLYHPILRGYSPNQDLLEWLQSCVLPTTPHLGPEDLYWGARLSLAECIESGVTSTIDWSYCLHSPEHALAVLRAVRESGMRVCYAFGPSLIGGDFDLDFDHLREVRDRFFEGRNESGRITLWAGLGGPNYQPEERVREEVRTVRELGLSIHLHLGEQHTQRSDDALPMLERCSGAGNHLLLAHAIHLNDADLELLSRTGTKVSYNALSNMRLATGVCRASEMWDRGIDVGLGLDSAGGSDNHDYFALLRAAVGLQRATHMRGDCLTVQDALEMATRRGARCLGLEAKIGSLEKGKEADIVLVDPRTINFAPVNDFVAQLVFCAQPRNVDTVIVGGEVLKRGGVLVRIDPGELMDHCEEAAARVAAKARLSRSRVAGRAANERGRPEVERR